MTAPSPPAYSHTNPFPCRAAAAFLSGASQSHAWKVWDLLSCTALEFAHPQHCRMSQPSCCSCSQLAARHMYKALKLNSSNMHRVERWQIPDILFPPSFLSLNLSFGSLCLTDGESTSASHSVSWVSPAAPRQMMKKVAELDPHQRDPWASPQGHGGSKWHA